MTYTMEKYINITVAQHGGLVEVKEFDMETGKLTMMMMPILKKELNYNEAHSVKLCKVQSNSTTKPITNRN